MKTIQEGNTALTEVPYEGNENYPAGVLVYEWSRTAEEPKTSRFEVEVYVEGYRMTKDVWLFETYTFQTLADALAFYHKINDRNWEQLDFESAEKNTGWYGLTVEYMKVFEYTPEGKFKWERKRGA